MADHTGAAYMRAGRSKEIIEELLSYADIKPGGTNPWDMQIHNEGFYGRVIEKGLLGLGESFMDGWWDVERLDLFSHKANRAKLDQVDLGSRRLEIALLIKPVLISRSSSKSFEVAKRHYDIGNDLYRAMLDRSMAYSCGYWKDAESLDEAQEAKHDLICRKLGIKKGMKVLDIGCGWGGFAKFAAQRYGAHVDGVTVSREQAGFAGKVCRDLPVRITLQDYRKIRGKQYDRIVSIGMFEHVGYRNYRTFMEVVNRLLSDSGLFLLHTIGRNSSKRTNDPWIEKYIFPNSMLPSIKQVGESAENLFVMEDWHNFSAYYDRTLMAWFKNFDANWKTLRHTYSERFYRMWKYYLLMCAGSFRARSLQLWQIVFSKNGLPGGYASVR